MIKIYNESTKETTYVNSIYEIPNGWRRYKNFKKVTKEKMSMSAKKRGAPNCAYRDKSGRNNPMFGKRLSETSKKKISDTKLKKQLENENYGVKGKIAYYDKDTKRIKYFSKDEIVPNNYIKGRPQ